jgi:hypothetical protein
MAQPRDAPNAKLANYVPAVEDVIQTFTESEFESYRQLGVSEVMNLATAAATLSALFQQADSQVRKPDDTAKDAGGPSTRNHWSAKRALRRF